MKKILLIIPVLLCFVYINLVSFSVFAISGGVERPGIETDAPEVDPDKYITLEELFANEKFKDAAERKYYFYFTYDQKHSSMDIWYNRSCVLTTNSDTLTVTEEDGIYTVSSEEPTIYFNHYQKRDGSFNGQNYTNSSFCSGFIYDSNFNTLTLINPSGSYPDDNTVIDNVQTNMFEVLGSGNFSVEFFPEMSGEVSKTIDMNGKQFDYPYLQFDVINKSNDYYQYAVFIVDKGTQITFREDYTNITSSQSGYFFTNKAIFCYITDEWFSTNLKIDGSSGSYGIAGQAASYQGLVYAPSAWHLSKPNDSNDSHHIGWNQLNLIPNNEYDCVVIACPIKVKSHNESGDGYDYHIYNYPQLYGSNPVEVIRSTFTVSSAMPYDPSDNSFDTANTHVYGYDSNNPNSTFDNLSAFVSESGKIIAGDKKFSGSISISSSGSSGSNIDLTNSIYFKDVFSNVFGYITTFFHYLPDGFSAVFLFGFTALIVIAIIKAVRG